MKSTLYKTETQKPSAQLKRRLRDYRAVIEKAVLEREYTRPESSLVTPSDTKYQAMIAKRVLPLMNATQVVLVGIGGSNLATEAVISAVKNTTPKKLLVLESIEAERMEEFRSLILKTKSLDTLAIFIVSKSGKTSETLMNAGEAIAIGVEKFGDIFLSRLMLIGDEDTELAVLAKKKKISYVSMPKIIGGRYSAFTGVSIAPLTVLGVDVRAYLKGATAFLGSEEQEEADARALYLAQAAESGSIHILNFFTFEDRLQKLGMWYRQLLAESTGKSHTKAKRPFTHHILPTVSTSADLHSMAQLYLGGLTGTFTHFVRLGEVAETSTHAVPTWLVAHIPELSRHTSVNVKQAITEGVIAAYADASLPTCDTVLSGVTPYEIGTFMAASMYEVMMIAHLLGVNAFDQPEVERYKTHTKALLSRSAKM
jgi:glucose-6-phosphate isomerase